MYRRKSTSNTAPISRLRKTDMITTRDGETNEGHKQGAANSVRPRATLGACARMQSNRMEILEGDDHFVEKTFAKY